ncbi:hypothetical protein [Heyndrickxia acidicola]|uniref:Uncharacterized protein n=1 Tax=Heyndrickxia acidicola TaxID=209389 RepID=A0ABU6MQZ1_9BACI|nr:hypothetical protein [Heyndrickxia acidicola]MED1206053.1 hypothetical protein [Heyndrickxia acidicola]
MKINLKDDQKASYVYVQSQFGFKSKVDWSGIRETPAGSAGLKETPHNHCDEEHPLSIPEAGFYNENQPAG